ncbi:hypothetical protein [Pseudanabaena sp. FACHB-2040]|uniref:hypothetical protein n=1 Tax=Pseudanabaena sp. FACHB-2040 TaxID=2692859 RepID=UPI0016875D67|nr:hypothetical protein [Pseudanabaena sp. FACHB-2040]MBD2257532.1 hypothetical protein [Pseudanabaena sp. FACHB-2040]
MGIPLKRITGITVALAAACLAAAPAAFAQNAPTIPEAVDEAFFNYSGDFFQNMSITGRAGSILGLGGFSEQQIAWDSNSVSAIIQDQLTVQNTIDPTIRVPDLANPFNTTLLLLPTYQSSGGVVGSQFIFETVPRR